MIDNMFNKKFGELIVLPIEHQKDKSSKRKYFCECICGNKKWIRKDHLINGPIKSCGCLRKELIKKEFFEDLSGKQFGRLNVLSINRKTIYNTYLYNCRCICGNEVIVFSGSLRTGATKSCGCLRSEVMKNRSRDYRISKGKDPEIFMNHATITERAEFLHSEIYQQVLKRDNYKCQFCPDTYENLEVHHILSWSKYPELRYKLTNLITLCKICHIPIIHNGDIKIEPHEQTTKMLQYIVIKNENM